MSDERPALVMYCGGVGGQPVEEMVARARAAAALDTLERAAATTAFGRLLLVADRPDLLVDIPKGVTVLEAPAPFHFGTALQSLVREQRLDSLLYMGAGSGCLLSEDDLRDIARRLAEDGVVVTNNYFSADFAGVSPAAAVLHAPAPASDNPLPRLLHEHAGLRVVALERTIANQFDIDTPTSLMVLALHGGAGPRLTGVVEEAGLPLDGYRRAAANFVNRERMVTIAGRVSSTVWRYLEQNTACRVRLFAEERGMQADGREERGEARSLVGMYLALTSPERLMEAFAELGDAAFIDTRVLTAHAGIAPSRPDRFLSDLGDWQSIEHPFLRDLTRAAAEARIPILLGGHALVSGGLMALVQAAWDIHDRGEG